MGGVREVRAGEERGLRRRHDRLVQCRGRRDVSQDRVGFPRRRTGVWPRFGRRGGLWPRR